MEHDRYPLLLSALLDGELTDTERDETLAHLDACEACRSYFAELTALHDAFGELDEIEPPEGFAAGVMARLHEEKPQARKPRAMRRGWLALAACAAIALLAIQTLPRAGLGSAAPKMAAARSMESAPVYYGAAVEAQSVAEDAAPAETQSVTTAQDEASEEAEALWETTMLFTSGSTANTPESSMDALVNDSKIALPMEPTAPAALMAEASLDGTAEQSLTLTGEGAAQWLEEHAEPLGEGRWRVTVEAVNELPDTLTLVGLQEPSEDGTLIITLEATENPQ